MKKRIAKPLLGVKSEQRACLRNQLKSIFQYGHIETAKTNAKQLVRLIDRLIARIKGKDELSAMRYLLSRVANRSLAKQILTYSRQALKKRSSGFSTQTMLGPRRGDGQERVIVKLLDFVPIKKPKKETKEQKIEPKEKVVKKK